MFKAMIVADTPITATHQEQDLAASCVSFCFKMHLLCKMYYDYNYDNKQCIPITATFIRGRYTKESKQLFQEWRENVEIQTGSSVLKHIFHHKQLITHRRDCGKDDLIN